MPVSPTNIADIRKDYSLAALDESVAGTEPVSFFQKWFNEALAAEITEVNAMTLATVSADNRPHARIVLLKGIENSGFTFFTNYCSHKGHEIDAHPNVALLFFWKELERQVRIEGSITKLSEAESDNYFNSRPLGSRLGAWASPQSQVITDRAILEQNYTAYEEKFSAAPPARPPHWGGYVVAPASIEFWQGRSNRMHDRILFTRENGGNWSTCRLAP